MPPLVALLSCWLLPPVAARWPTPAPPARRLRCVLQCRVWGVAYELDDLHPDAAAARSRLAHRERWFEQRRVPFWRVGSVADAPASPPREVELFIATAEGPNFLGAAPAERLAREIAEPRGPSGAALEYFRRVLQFQRSLGCEARDEHLEMLAPLVELAAARIGESQTSLEREK